MSASSRRTTRSGSFRKPPIHPLPVTSHGLLASFAGPFGTRKQRSVWLGSKMAAVGCFDGIPLWCLLRDDEDGDGGCGGSLSYPIWPDTPLRPFYGSFATTMTAASVVELVVSFLRWQSVVPSTSRVFDGRFHQVALLGTLLLVHSVLGTGWLVAHQFLVALTAGLVSCGLLIVG